MHGDSQRQEPDSDSCYGASALRLWRSERCLIDTERRKCGDSRVQISGQGVNMPTSTREPTDSGALSGGEKTGKTLVPACKDWMCTAVRGGGGGGSCPLHLRPSQSLFCNNSPGRRSQCLPSRTKSQRTQASATKGTPPIYGIFIVDAEK